MACKFTFAIDNHIMIRIQIDLCFYQFLVTDDSVYYMTSMIKFPTLFNTKAIYRPTNT